MAEDWLTRLLRRFARPDADPIRGAANLDVIDTRLSVVEREQREIEARLRLLEMQADMRQEP